jgi:lipopolysaccharide/colanic/teichoic acid biosynthesis glycosyltransferase
VVVNAMSEVQLVYRQDRAYGAARRGLDLLVALAALALSAPVLVVAALAIAVEDGRPVLFRQERVGRFGRTFTMYKFRTMRSAACGSAYKPQSTRDPRITRVGRVLRKLSIDELPQFINVVRGEMAVVGPRPEMPFIVARYERWQHLRTLAPPGITGLWQTTVRSTVPLDRPEATLIDLDYVRRASTPLDLVLVARTFAIILFPRGAF